MKAFLQSILNFFSNVFIARSVSKSVFRLFPYCIYGIDTYEFTHHFESFMDALPVIVWLIIIQIIIIESHRKRKYGWVLWALVIVMVGRMLWPYVENDQIGMSALLAFISIIGSELAIHLWGDHINDDNGET